MRRLLMSGLLPLTLFLATPPAALDIAGRKAMDLAPGPNDVRHLAPGVYFVRTASSVHKVILTR